MNERSKFATRLAVLALALAALGAWFALGQGESGQAQGGLAISMTDAPDPVAQGGTVTYTITVTNTGTDTEPGVVLNDTLSGPATIVGAVPSQGGCNHTGTTVHCALGTIGPGATATITVVKKATKDVGGILEFVDPSELRAASAESAPSSSRLPLAGTAGGAAAAAAVVAAGLGIGGWYMRRRLS